MTRLGWVGGPERKLPTALAPAAIAIALALSIALVPASSSALSGVTRDWSPASISWNNGVVLCVFGSGLPSVAVSPYGLNNSGLSSGLQQIDEVRSNGSVVAIAALSVANWSMHNASTPDTFDMEYLAHASVRSAVGTGPVVGSVEVQVDYVLAAYQDSNPVNPSSVAAQLRISNWTWQQAGDQLAILVPLWPTSAAAEHLNSASSSSTLISSVDNATGTTREYFQLTEVANATPATGTPVPVTVLSSSSIRPSSGSVLLTMGSAAGEFRSLAYVAHFGIPGPSALAGIPIYELVLVGLAAGIVSVLVALGTRSVRRRPSDLTFVEEEA